MYADDTQLYMDFRDSAADEGAWESVGKEDQMACVN